MASVYSLRLLQHEVAREWLLAREEPKLPPSFMESSLALRHRVFLGSKPKFVDQLFQPIGVVNGVLIGYSLANYHLVLPADWVPTVEPVVRRFALDLSNNEFLELHWFQNNTVMTCWLKFASSTHRIRYFVLYEAPPHGKLPFKLLKSVELVLQRVDDAQIPESEEESSMLAQLADPSVNVLSLAQERLLSIIPKSRVKAKRHLGIFYGTARKTVYKDLSVVDDCFLPYRQCTHVLRETNEEMLQGDSDAGNNNPQKSIQLPLINVRDGAMMIKEFLSMERQTLGHNKAVPNETMPMDPFERRQRRRYILSVKRAHKARDASGGKTERTVFQAAELLSRHLFRPPRRHTFHSDTNWEGGGGGMDAELKEGPTPRHIHPVGHLQVGLYDCGVTYSLPASEGNSHENSTSYGGAAGGCSESDIPLQWIDFDPIGENVSCNTKDNLSGDDDTTTIKNSKTKHAQVSSTKRSREEEEQEPSQLHPWLVGTPKRWKDAHQSSFTNYLWEDDDLEEETNDDFLNTLHNYLFALENEDGDCFRVTDTKEDALQNFLERSFV
ncbi:hypothetical protein GAYE_SCF48G6020 [Galdieria yellowstonensis]|uniref:Uncharacterized protein n=1 Tax=Galdieria yellowstonensis TaxID=3028027 RepID=A0AAV9IL30_9RHOD|nr:hypothetical protein GAYE_SCF48G6020 [Galdieria yellowstonensis]